MHFLVLLCTFFFTPRVKERERTSYAFMPKSIFTVSCLHNLHRRFAFPLSCLPSSSSSIFHFGNFSVFIIFTAVRMRVNEVGIFIASLLYQRYERPPRGLNVSTCSENWMLSGCTLLLEHVTCKCTRMHTIKRSEGAKLHGPSSIFWILQSAKLS